ncbi:MAG: hypothetical protein JRH15_09385 [Deltaproteobacteria bacterium]|nr:hypothetical protein [Deltaproteobacteria bacterium]
MGFVVLRILCFFAVLLMLSGTGFASILGDKLYDRYEIEVNGFVEFRQGVRLQDDPNEKGASISEARLQLELSRSFDWGMLKVKGDLVDDLVRSQGQAALRELHLSLSPLDFLDVKIGRQVLTWGTGDLLFINDLFPKDWESFFIGRDDAYLKSPSDAVKLSFYFDVANVDIVTSPLANPSVYIDGTRLSYWNGLLGRRAGRDFIFSDHDRNRFFTDGETSIRVFKNIAGAEVALYGYHGFWKTPEGVDPVATRLFYPDLTAYGAGVRLPVFGGIGNVEIGYYDSSDDSEGDDPLVRNSEFRFLAGFEREIARDFTGGFQYYLEWMDNYDAYRQSIGAQPAKDEFRHLFTLRLTKQMMNQNLKLTLFTYYSPSDQDAYLRPNVHYKVTDNWAAEVGANLFFGEENHTFFGQFEDNTNMYVGGRFSF